LAYNQLLTNNYNNKDKVTELFCIADKFWKFLNTMIVDTQRNLLRKEDISKVP